MIWKRALVGMIVMLGVALGISILSWVITSVLEWGGPIALFYFMFALIGIVLGVSLGEDI